VAPLLALVANACLAGIVLGVHGVLGLVSWTGFEAIARGLQNDDFGPQRWALPLAARVET